MSGKRSELATYKHLYFSIWQDIRAEWIIGGREPRPISHYVKKLELRWPFGQTISLEKLFTDVICEYAKGNPSFEEVLEGSGN